MPEKARVFGELPFQLSCSHAPARCHTGTSCWGDSNDFTCYSPTCSAIPADNCGPNDCYTDADLFGEVSMDTPGYSYCNALHRTESDDTCCEGGDISCGRRLSEEPAFKENLTAHGRSLGHCCDLAAFCECLQNYVAPPPSSPYATCEPNRDKCDSSIGGDCCTARATDHEERRCRDGWIPIYIGVLPLLRRCLSCVDAGKGSRLRRAALSTELLPRPCTVPHRNIVLGRQQRLHLLLPDMFGNSCG